MKQAIRQALPYTIPVLAGYIFLGIAFGFLMETKGFPIWYPIIMSAIIYSGALEFAAIPLLEGAFNPLGALMLGLMLSARHLFYGIPMLKKYENSGKLKLPLIYTLTDEAFSISSTIDAPQGVNSPYFYAAISFFNYLYWQIGTILGAVFGSMIKFDTTGIDFALTALFIVLFLEQIRTREGLISGFVGLIVTASVLALVGSEKMVIVSMIAILVILELGKKVIVHD